jgi:hypothetical protein
MEAVKEPTLDAGTEKLTLEELDAKKVAAAGASALDLDDPSNIPENMRPYIEKLRKENQTLRSKSKETASKLEEINGKFSKMEKSIKKLGGVAEDEAVDADELTNQLTQQQTNNQALQFRASVLEIALENGLNNRDAVDFLSYKIEKAAQELGDGEELTEEAVLGIVKQVKTQFGSKSSSTSIDGTRTNPAPDGDAITVEKFASMSMTEKQLLCNKNPKLYDQLFKTAVEKRILI